MNECDRCGSLITHPDGKTCLTCREEQEDHKYIRDEEYDRGEHE